MKNPMSSCELCEATIEYYQGVAETLATVRESLRVEAIRASVYRQLAWEHYESCSFEFGFANEATINDIDEQARKRLENV